MNCSFGNLMVFLVLGTNVLVTKANPIPQVQNEDEDDKGVESNVIPEDHMRQAPDNKEEQPQARSDDNKGNNELEDLQKTADSKKRSMMEVAYAAGRCIGKDITGDVQKKSGYQMKNCLCVACRTGIEDARSLKLEWTHEQTEFLKLISEKLEGNDKNTFLLGYKLGQVLHSGSHKNQLLSNINFYVKPETIALFTMGYKAGKELDGALNYAEAKTLAEQKHRFIEFAGSELSDDAKAQLNAGFNAGTSMLGNMVNDFADEVQNNIDPDIRFIYQVGFNMGNYLYSK